MCNILPFFREGFFMPNGYLYEILINLNKMERQKMTKTISIYGL